MSKGHTLDSVNFDNETGNHSFLLFTRDNNLLMNHPITLGRNESERINRVLTFTYGATGTQTVNDTVANWRNFGPCRN